MFGLGKSYRFTGHALDEMRADRISERQVIWVIEHPEEHGPARDGKLQSWAVVDGRGIKVVYANRTVEMVIVTVMHQRRRMK